MWLLFTHKNNFQQHKTRYQLMRRHFFFRGEPGLVDRVLAFYAGSRGFDSHRGHMSKRFFPWRMVIAVSALSNRQNCACARGTLQTQRGRTHGAGCVRQWFCTAEPLRERCYENWNTHTLRRHFKMIPAFQQYSTGYTVTNFYFIQSDFAL